MTEMMTCWWCFILYSHREHFIRMWTFHSDDLWCLLPPVSVDHVIWYYSLYEI